MRARHFISLAAGLVAMAFAASQAQARPRDEVMSGAYRCAAIGDARLWLDCFYGAAQPVRGALGLRPAPDGQVALVTRPPASAASAKDLAVRETVMGEVFRCGGQADERAWLDCYYAAAQSARISLGLAQGPAPAPRVASAAAPPKNDFGMPPPPPAGIPASAKSVWSPMADYTFAKTGYFTVTLANGQVWRQIDGDTSFARWKETPDRNLVHVTHGFLGSFNLQVKGEPGKYKVERIR